MLEKGRYDAKTLATTVVPIERMLEHEGRVPDDHHGVDDGVRPSHALESSAVRATFDGAHPSRPAMLGQRLRPRVESGSELLKPRARATELRGVPMSLGCSYEYSQRARLSEW